MIPQFPEFKKIELSDRADIEKFTSKYDPYSDFNFVEMWCWNLNNSMEISELNGNLVIRPNDLFSNGFTLSYLGNNNLDSTLDQLYNFLEKKRVEESKLCFVPEVSLLGIDLKKYMIEIDINNSDYVFDVIQLANYEGSNYSKKRIAYNNFIRHYADTKVSLLDTTQPNVQSEILDLTRLWTSNKKKSGGSDNNDMEISAIVRFLDSNFKNIICVGATFKGNLISYMIFSLSPREYTICHFAKGDISFYGVYEYLMAESSKILLKKGIKFMNHQEDLGLEGLRFSKNSYQPVNFLRAYTITRL